MGEVQRLTNCTTGGPVFVDVEDGRIVRMYPIDLADDDKGDWVIEARGRKFTPPRRTTLSPHAQAQRSMVYSPKRILHPMKRVDWDPKGERNTQQPRRLRATSRSAGTTALDLVTDELDPREARERPRLHPHHLQLAPPVGQPRLPPQRLLPLPQPHGHGPHCAHNPDSWEGWHWGAMPMWGNSHRLGIPEQYDLLEDALKHTEMVVFWSSDPETTGGGIYSAFESTSRRYWMKELGIKMVFVDPYYNPTAELFSDKWFAPRLGTDVAFGLGIAHTWLAEGLYDKEYVAERTTGFDEWKDYVLGMTDNVPKTPEWAESECGIPARQIRALAREWGSKKVMLAAGGLGGWGGACRSATGNEWARTMVALAAMQGYGKPGVNIWGTSQGAPSDCSFVFPGYAEGGMSGDPEKSAAGYRMLYRIFAHETGLHPTVNAHDSPEGIAIPRLRIPEAMMHEKFEWRGKGFCGPSIQSQMQKYQYPAPGYPFVTMYWRYGGSFFGTMQQTNRYVKAYREGKVRTVVNQSIWMEGEAKFADIILPACTNFERWDMSEFGNCSGYIPDNHTQTSHRVIVFQKKCIEPLGESRSDYDIFAAVAERMGMGDVFTEGGMDEYDWCKAYFDATDLPQITTWEEFEKKGYVVVPFPDDYKSTPAMRWFAEGRKRDTPDWGPSARRHRRLRGPADAVRQDRVRQHGAQAPRDGRRRPRAAGDGPAVHPELGGPPHDGAVRQVPAADGEPAPALQLPHHGRLQGHVAQRGGGAPHPARGRPPLLDHAPEQRGRGGAGHRRGRPHPRLQRPRRRSSSPPRSPSGWRRAPCTPTRAAPTTCRPASPASPPTSPAASTSSPTNASSPRRPSAMSNNSCLIQVEKWEGEAS